MAPMNDRTELLNKLTNCLGLNRDDDARRNFFALAQVWLLRYCVYGMRLPLANINTIPPIVKIETILDDATLAFLTIFGPRLWPPLDRESERRHLLQSCTLQYHIDAVRDIEREIRLHRLPNRPRGYYGARFQYSELRVWLREYLKVVGDTPYDRSEDGGPKGSVDEMFARVIGREEGGYPVEPEEENEMEG
ncbi:hypothetical protein LTR10_009246 [Elasticomyces elasticus]|nr:hypothetical protein LTR10_009246 [Elasticomyces elasticus]KAK4971654.1 hypothetical protein LTR42_007382 [Elasticomyces elasticus]